MSEPTAAAPLVSATTLGRPPKLTQTFRRSRARYATAAAAWASIERATGHTRNSIAEAHHTRGSWTWTVRTRPGRASTC